MRRVTITAYGNFGFNEYLGLEAAYILRGHPFVSATFNGTPTVPETKTYDFTEGQWDRVGPTLEKLSQQSLAVIVPSTGLRNGTYRPLMVYSCEPLPTARARLLKVHPGVISLGDAAISLVIAGENLMHGAKASGTLGVGVAGIAFLAQRQGPEGNNITVEIFPSRPTGAVSVVMTEGPTGFFVKINVIPVAGAPTAAAVAAQINANTLANFYVQATAVGGGAGVSRPGSLTLTEGEGSAIAYAHFINSVSERLTVTARKPGNGGRLINVRFAAAAGGGNVAVTGNAIVVTPALAANTISDIVTLMNTPGSPCAALVFAAGAGAAGLGVVPATFLHGGAGEDVVVKVGPTTVVVTSHTDTQIEGTLNGTTLAGGGGYVATDVVMLNIYTGFERLQASIPVVV